MSGNTCVLAGNLTADPELRYTPSGTAVANFSVAVNKRVKDGNDWKDELEGYFRCTAWREMAENVTESLKKGMRVVLTGRLQMRHWEDDSGTKHQSVEIQVDDVGPSLRWAIATVEKAKDKQPAMAEGGF